MKDGKRDINDEKSNISRTSGRADTRVGAMERDCQELSFEPKIGWNGGGTHLGLIQRSPKMGRMITRERADGLE